jgi:hypothetical protein
LLLLLHADLVVSRRRRVLLVYHNGMLLRLSHGWQRPLVADLRGK